MAIRGELEDLLRNVTHVLAASSADSLNQAPQTLVPPAFLRDSYAALGDALCALVEKPDHLSGPATARLEHDPDLVQLAFHMAEEVSAVRAGQAGPNHVAWTLGIMGRHVQPAIDLLARAALDEPEPDTLPFRLARLTRAVYERRFAPHYAQSDYRRPFIDKLFRDYRRDGLPAALLGVLAEVAASGAYDRCVVVLKGALGYALLLELLGFPEAALRFVSCGRACGSHIDMALRFEPLGFAISDLAGKRVLVLDNNVLTGLTLRRCIAEVARAGAAGISVLVDYVHPASPPTGRLDQWFLPAVTSVRVARDEKVPVSPARSAALSRTIEQGLADRLAGARLSGAPVEPGTSQDRRHHSAPGSRVQGATVEPVRFTDRPLVVDVAGHPFQYAPMRLEWRRDAPDVAPLLPAEMRLEHTRLDPFVIQVQITPACNLTCSYCTAIYNPRAARQKTLSDAEISYLQAEIRALPADGLAILMGGEPFLERESVFALVEAASVTTVIFTNGTLLTRDDLRRLRGTRAVLLLSLDGDEETTAVKRFHRRRENMVERIFAAADMVAESGIPFGISMVLGSHNIDQIEHQVEVLHDRYRPASFGVSTPHFAKLAPGADDLAPERVAAAYVRLFHLCVRRGIYLDQIARRLRPLVAGTPLIRDCNATGQKRVYYPGGAWLNCANQEDLGAGLDVWARHLPIFTPSCHGCVGIGLCGGGCIYDAEKFGSEENPYDPRHCATVRALTMAFLEHITRIDGLDVNDHERLREEFGHVLGRRDQSLRFSTGHMTNGAAVPGTGQ